MQSEPVTIKLLIEFLKTWDVTDDLYQNRKFPEKLYDDFKGEINISKQVKPNREEFKNSATDYKKEYNSPIVFDKSKTDQKEYGYCIRTGVKIPFNIKRPFSLDAYHSWANFQNWNYRENYCHKTGENSNEKNNG